MFETRRGRRQHVAVHRLDRGDAFEQQVDAGSPRFALVALVEPAAHALRVPVGVAVALHLRVELGELGRMTGRDLIGRAAHRASSCSATASAVAPVPSIRPGAAANNARRLASGPAIARARASWPPESPAASAAWAESTPSAASAAASASSATGSKSMRWQRDRIVGNRSSATDVTNTRIVRVRRLFQRLEHRVGRLVLVAAQLLGFEQQQHFALGLDRASVRLGQDALAHVGLHRVRRAAGLELDDVGVHPPLDEPLRPLVVGVDQARRESARRLLDARPPRPDEQVRVRGPFRRALERGDRSLLAYDVGPHRLHPTEESVGTQRPDLLGDFFACPARVEQRPLVQGCEIAVRIADRGMELIAGPFEAIGLLRNPGVRDLIRQVEHNDEIRFDTPTDAYVLIHSTASTPSARPMPW